MKSAGPIGKLRLTLAATAARKLDAAAGALTEATDLLIKAGAHPVGGEIQKMRELAEEIRKAGVQLAQRVRAEKHKER